MRARTKNIFADISQVHQRATPRNESQSEENLRKHHTGWAPLFWCMYFLTSWTFIFLQMCFSVRTPLTTPTTPSGRISCMRWLSFTLLCRCSNNCALTLWDIFRRGRSLARLVGTCPMSSTGQTSLQAVRCDDFYRICNKCSVKANLYSLS